MNSHTAAMPRADTELPEEVNSVADGLRAVAKRDGLTRAKLARAPALLSLVTESAPANQAEQARLVESLIRRHVNAVPSSRDHALLVAGLNLDGAAGKSIESRVTEVVAEIDRGSPDYLEAESAIGRFRYELLNELAWRLGGGGPLSTGHPSPSLPLALAERLLSQGRNAEAAARLRQLATGDPDGLTRREAWRTLAIHAYERGDYDMADDAFAKALRHPGTGTRGGKLAMAIDRYAVRLTNEEYYERALAVVEDALGVYFDGRWLWRRYGCVKWYANDLLGAYAALSVALERGYPRSRVFHARGQVLAELGRYDEAVEELSQALAAPRSDLSTAYAQSARAFARGMSVGLAPALNEFESAERTIPDSGWLHYWRALCLHRHGHLDEARVGMQRALASTTSPLNRCKREHATRFLAEPTPPEQM